MATDPKTLERVRRILSKHKDVVEKPMVGGSRGLMVNGKLCISVGTDRILVRVDPTARLKLLKEPGARPMKMGDKTLTRFIYIDPPGYRNDTQLKAWIQQGLDALATAAEEKTKPTRKR